MLRFDLAEIIRTPGMQQEFRVHEAPFTDEDVEYVSPISGLITVTNTGSVLLVRGPIHTSIALECSRCLEPVRSPVDVELEEDFDLKVVDDHTHHDRVIQIVADDIENPFDGKVLRMDVLIRQAALLAAPLQPLCRLDCPGIPIRSEVKSAENSTFVQSPFQVLKQMLDD